jgi:hypothetical protein
MRENKKKYKLKNLSVFSVHFVSDPAVEKARFIIKKEKGGLNMDNNEIINELTEEQKVANEVVIKENEKQKDIVAFVKEFLDKVQEEFKEIPNAIAAALENLKKSLEGYGYPEAYPEPVEKSQNSELMQELQKSKKELEELKVELWARDRISEGKPPALINVMKQKVLEGKATTDVFDEVLKATNSIVMKQVSVDTETSTKQNEIVDKIAELLNWKK